MKKSKIILSTTLMLIANSVFAQGSIGLVADVSVDGFFSPELVEFKIKSVVENSAAEKAGVIVGQQVISIDGCDIPGCPASKAKKLMKRETGEILPLRVKNTDGTETLIEILVE